MRDKQQASKQLAENCAEMSRLFRECINLATVAQIPFDLPWGGEGCSAEDGYGAGATFYPEGVDNYNKWSDGSQWISSSQTC